MSADTASKDEEKEELRVPKEINTHYQLYNTEWQDVDYDDGHYDSRCPICDSRIDEYGYCACGGNLGVS